MRVLDFLTAKWPLSASEQTKLSSQYTLSRRNMDSQGAAAAAAVAVGRMDLLDGWKNVANDEVNSVLFCSFNLLLLLLFLCFFSEGVGQK